MFWGKKRLGFAIVLLSAISFSLPLNAAILSIDNVFYGYKDVSVTYTDDSGSSRSLVTDTGTFLVKYEGYHTWGFCVDLGTSLDLSNNTSEYANEYTYYTTEVPKDYNENLVYVEWLLDQYGQDAYSTTNGSNPKGAALQLAIWEVLYDLHISDTSGTYNLDYFNWDYVSDGDNTGGIYVGANDFYYNRTGTALGAWVNTFYDEYIDALIDAIDDDGLDSSYESTGNYVVAVLENGQDIIVNVVPEPATAMLLGFGLLGLCAVGRKRA